MSDVLATLAELGSATVYEASGRAGALDGPFTQVIPGSRVAGPARTVLCGQGDNLMVHAALSQSEPGEVLVITMPRPQSVALVGDLLALQASRRGLAGLLIDGAVRDADELVEIGLPIWARCIAIHGATKDAVGTINQAVSIGTTVVRAGDVVVLDRDGGVIVEQQRIDEVTRAAQERAAREHVKRGQLAAGALSYDLDGLRARVESVASP